MVKIALQRYDIFVIQTSYTPKNVHKILDLKEKQGLKDKDLLHAIGRRGTSVKHLFFRNGEPRNVSAETLEKIADVLGVSIDEFFDRAIPNSGVIVSGSSIIGNRITQNVSDHQHLKELMAEKDKRIALLEQLIEVLQADKN